MAPRKTSKSASKDVKSAMHKRKEGYASERTKRKEGDEQKAGNSYRTLRSS